MNTGYYILKGREIVKEPDLLTWGKWFETADRFIKQEDIYCFRFHWKPIVKVFVSTIFLGLDHSWGPGDPILFETMIFNGKHDQEQRRYHTYEEAEQGHEDMVDSYCESWIIRDGTWLSQTL